MANYQVFAGLGVVGALIIAPMAEAQQVPAAGPSQPGDLELACPALAVEMSKAAQMLASTPPAAASAQQAPVQTAPAQMVSTLASAVGGQANLETVGRAYQQAQNAQQLANLQVLAARGGVGRGTATAAIGGLAALQQVAANGGNVRDAAGSVAGDAVGNALASRIPGGKMIGGMLGGFLKKKPKPAPVDVAAAVAPVTNAAQARLAFLGALVSAKGCK